MVPVDRLESFLGVSAILYYTYLGRLCSLNEIIDVFYVTKRKNIKTPTMVSFWVRALHIGRDSRDGGVIHEKQGGPLKGIENISSVVYSISPPPLNESRLQ